MGVFSAWAVAIGLQTYRDVKAGRAPLPSEFVASGAVFAALAALDQAAHPLGGALAWGFLVALFLEVGPQGLVNATNPTTPKAVAGRPGHPGKPQKKQKGRLV